MSKLDPYSRVEYRRLIAWPNRIQRERPFLEKVLSTGPATAGTVSRVLDLGCGTGEHSRFLAEQGYDVVGIDRSESMLAQARDEPLPHNLRFLEGDLARLGELDDGLLGGEDFFHGAICLGNTLPHLDTPEALEGFVRGLRRRLMDSAPVIFQLLNYDRIFEHGIRHLPVNFRPDGEGQLVFLRLMEPRDNGRVIFCPTTLRWTPDGDPPVHLVSSRRVELRGWTRSELEAALDAAGFVEHQAFGAFDGCPWDASVSHDLILVAR